MLISKFMQDLYNLLQIKSHLMLLDFCLKQCQLTVVINVSGLSVDTPAYIEYLCDYESISKLPLANQPITA